MKIFIVTNTIFRFGYYLIFTKKVTMFIFKKIYSTTFDILTLISPLIFSTVHSILSPADTFIIWAIGAGTVVLTELLFVVPFDILVFCLNTTVIPPYFLLIIIIYAYSTINILPLIKYKNKGNLYIVS